MVSDVRRPSSTIASKDMPSLTTGLILTKLDKNITKMSLFKIVQLVPD